MFKRIQVIVNPAAGGDRPILSTLNSAFHAAGVDWDVSITKKAGDGKQLARAAAESGVDAVAVYGGDGTITEVAEGLIGSQLPLAILPGGTANAIALALGIPMDLPTACALALSPDNAVRTVDMGQVGERGFLIAVGVGIAGALAEAADREAKDRLGPLAYALASLDALRRSRVANYRMVLDGKEIMQEGVTCVIANAGNFGVPGVSLAPGIDMADGLLDVVVIPSARIGPLVSAAATIVLPTDNEPFPHWTATTIQVTPEPLQAIQADGEVLEPAPLSIKVLPGAVRVIVPREAKPGQ